MDISSSLAKYASRKQLRRFAASLSLQADEPGSLTSLLNLDKFKVRDALKSSFKNATECAALQTTIEKWMEHGAPQEILENVDSAVDAEENIHATTEVPSIRPKTAPPQCCVECHTRTPYLFQLLNCRLCAPCERANSKYTLMTLACARSMHGLSESDLRGVRSMGHGDKRFFLRSDIEKCSVRAHGSSDAELAALKREASREWKQNSFSTDRRGKTQKWKEWNSVTYQKKQSMRKQDSGLSMTIDDATSDCLDLSGLVRVD